MSTAISDKRTVAFTAKALCPNLACEESGKPSLDIHVVATVINERFVTYNLPIIRCLKCGYFCPVDGWDVGRIRKDSQ